MTFNSFSGLWPSPNQVFGKFGFSGKTGNLSFQRAQKRPLIEPKNSDIRNNFMLFCQEFSLGNRDRAWANTSGLKDTLNFKKISKKSFIILIFLFKYGF